VSDERTIDDVWREIGKFWTYGYKNRPLNNTNKGREAREKSKELAQRAWKNTVSDLLLAEAVLKEAREVWDALETGSKPPHLSELIRGVQGPDFGVADPEPGAPPQPMAIPERPAAVESFESRSARAFKRVLAAWPPSLKYHEAEATSASAWRSVATQGNLADLVTACEYYIAAVQSGEEAIAHTLKWFLTRGLKDEEECWWQHYLVRARHGLDSRGSAAFAAAFAAYPDFPDKEGARGAGAELFHRFVPVGLRLDNLLAILAYATKRYGEEPEHTLRFASFIRGWQRRAEELPIEYDGVGGALLRALAAAGSPLVGDEADFPERSIAFFVRDRGKTVREAVELSIGKLQSAGLARGLDAPTTADAVTEAAYVSACKRLGVVIESRLDAARPGVSDSLPSAQGVAR
jgi:hypothetical protein